jgi:hypothetical protein
MLVYLTQLEDIKCGNIIRMASPEFTWPNLNLFVLTHSWFKECYGCQTLHKQSHTCNNFNISGVFCLMLILTNAVPECDCVWVKQEVIPTHLTF